MAYGFVGVQGNFDNLLFLAAFTLPTAALPLLIVREERIGRSVDGN